MAMENLRSNISTRKDRQLLHIAAPEAVLQQLTAIAGETRSPAGGKLMFKVDATHSPSLQSWVESAQGNPDFPIQNLPLGIFARPGRPAVGGTAIGDFIVDLSAAAFLFTGAAKKAAESAGETTLNSLLALGPEPRRELRRQLSVLLSQEAARHRVEPYLVPASQCTMKMPTTIGDFTDFFVGIHHATNCAVALGAEPIAPEAFKHLPIGYHGRASSVRLGGTPVRRPAGQYAFGHEAPRYQPTAALDYELELGMWIGKGNALGKPISIDAAEDHLAGFCLLIDWSARDFQFWESRPLGPFLSKSFLTSISPWIVTPEALAPFRIPSARETLGDGPPLSYLNNADDLKRGGFKVCFDLSIITALMRERSIEPHELVRVDTGELYWTPAQMIAHHASGGCNLCPGDLFGSGTISGQSIGSMGCLLESTLNGRRQLDLPGGEYRTYLEDGDEIVVRGTARAEGFVDISLGECRGRVTGTDETIVGDE